MGFQQNNVNNGPSYPCSEPCANNCGFFGSSEKRNLCSKCYKEFCLVEELAAMKTVKCSAASPLSPAEQSNRCGTCNRKVGLTTGFVCKCGSTLCGLHRYPEIHKCFYDFKAAGREAISKANPVVKRDKLQKF